MRTHVILGAAVACLVLTSGADARLHHRTGAPCPNGLLYRPSLGICQSRPAFRQAMRANAASVSGPRAEPRRSTRRERRRQLREAAREARGPSRLLPTRPYTRKVFTEDETESRTAATGTIPEAPQTHAAPARDAQGPAARADGQSPEARERGPLQPVEFSGIPWTLTGPFSLNPLSRHAARSDLDWRR